MASGGRLIVICGLPGSGKTTVGSTLERELGASRFSPDDWMDSLGLDLYDEPRRAAIEDLQWRCAQQILALGGTAIIEWGTWARLERDRLRLGARALGAAAELIYLDAPTEVLFERIRQRNRETPPITLEAMQNWSAHFQAPTPEELSLYDPPAKAVTP